MSLRYALLGVLSLKEATGYDIKRRFDRSMQFFWNADDSQIYRELRTMERDGLVCSRLEEQAARPSKRIYQITGAGERELDDWLGSVPERQYIKDPFMLRIFFIGRLPAHRARALLQHRCGELTTALATFESNRQYYQDPGYRSRHEDLLWWQMHLLEGTVRVLRAELEWLQKLLREPGLALPEEPSAMESSS
jgi:PadR family transcriptional regulator AphA